MFKNGNGKLIFRNVMNLFELLLNFPMKLNFFMWTLIYKNIVYKIGWANFNLSIWIARHFDL